MSKLDLRPATPSDSADEADLKEKSEGVIIRTLTGHDDKESAKEGNDSVSDEGRRLAGDERNIFTEEESEAVKRKVDRVVVPLLALVYFTQFLGE